MSDVAQGLNFQLAGSILTYGSTSMTLSNLHNASLQASAAPEGGVQIFFGGPPLIVSSTLVAESAQSASAKLVEPMLDSMTGQPDHASLTNEIYALDPNTIRTAGDLFDLP